MALTKIKTGGITDNAVTDAKVANAITVTGAQTGITQVGTLTAGTWQGTAIASAYLDADTAHLSTTQTFTGTKTFQSEHTYLENTGGNCNLFIKSSNSGNARLYLGDVADAGAGFIDYDNGTNMTIGTEGTVALTIDSSQQTTFTRASTTDDNKATVKIEPTGSHGMGLHVYSNADNDANALVQIHSDNASMNMPALRVIQDGTGDAAWLNGGNVSIGNNSPTTKLHITADSTEEDVILLEDNSGTDIGAIKIHGGAFVMKGKSSTAPVQLQTHDGNEDIEVDPDGFIKFETAGSERLRIDSSGNVIIPNTTAAGNNSQSLPGYLSFQGYGWDSDSGSDAIEGRITFAGSYGGTSAGAHSGGGVIPKLEFGIVNSGDTGDTSESLTTVMSVHGAQHDLTGGSVSIAGGQSDYSSLGIHTGGTNSYGATQGHHQNSAITIDFPNADQSYGCLRWRSHGNMEHFFGVVQQGASSQGDFVWQGFNGSAYKEWMRLNKGGQLGINTADNYGDAPLHVVGEGDVDAFGYPQLVLEGNSHNYPGIVFRGSGGTHAAMRIENGDGYSFWTTDHSNASQNWNNRLRIAEDGTFTGSSSADISDRNLKKNIKSISNGLETIKKLQGRTFEWKVSSQMAEGVKYGLIAQELEEVLPDLVYNKTGIVEKEDGTFYKSVFMGGVIPVLIEAVKELSAKVEALEGN